MLHRSVLCFGRFCFIITGIVLIVNWANTECEKETRQDKTEASDLHGRCLWSDEAEKIGLEEFLQKVQDEYYELLPQNLPWKPSLSSEEKTSILKQRFFPYNPEPSVLKKKTDRSMELLQEINKKTVNTNQLKTRESKALAQVKHFLESNFGVPYDDNYYSGDWMLGPNIFCWQPLCDLTYSLAKYASYVKPQTLDDVNIIIKTIWNHKTVIDQYKANIQLGVRVGMVRSVVDCQSGVDALKERFSKVSQSETNQGILDESFIQTFLKSSYLDGLSQDEQLQWKSKAKQSVTQSIQDALINGIGQPVLELINYLQNEHMLHCLPTGDSSGLSRLPVEYVFYNGTPLFQNKTTRVLPTKELLDGKVSYKIVLPYFTTTDISPEEIFKEGKKQLDFFYNQIKEIAKNYTSISDEATAILTFKKTLNSNDQWHNKNLFPDNESDEIAHKRCNNAKNAQKNCPIRWKHVQIWADYMRDVMGKIVAKVTPVFHFTGTKTTVPNCPIEMLPHYNPSLGTMFFQSSDAVCSKPSYFGLPFFLKRYGPKFQEWSVNAHEARPGHHFQIQGRLELFPDVCGGVIDWLNENNYYIAFQEGWALYAENPIMSDDTNLYDSDMLQKYGMLKWQVWRAVRLIVDTGLHYRNMSRKDALKMFEDYTWDSTDFAVKEVTRYQSVPGQATAYMLGRLGILSVRRKAERQLGDRFNLRDFHYQVLSQGSSPLAFYTVILTAGLHV